MALVAAGAASLIDQSVWVRRAALGLGSTSRALGVVLMVFFLGLALGSAWFARRAGRTAHPLRLAARLEAALAPLVLATLALFAAADHAFGAAYRALPPDSPWLLAVRAGLVLPILLPPAILMGGTLPLVARAAVADARRLGADVARVYALNTLGAAAGAFVAGFMLLPRVGFLGSLTVAAVLHLVAAGLLARAPESAPVPESAAPAPRRELPARRALAAVLAAGGFVALGGEILWARFLVLVVHDRVTSVAWALTVTLLGIVAGSLLAARVADRSRRAGLWLGAFTAGGALAALALIHRPPSWWHGLGGEIVAVPVLLLPSALLGGAALPLAVRLAAREAREAGAALGQLLAWNTAGGLAGAGLTGFVLLPAFGVADSARVLAAVGVGGAWVAWFALERGRPLAPRALLAGAALAALALAPVAGASRVPQDFLAPAGRLLAWREGIESFLAVLRGSDGERVLEMDRTWQGQDRRTHQVMAAHLPMLLHPDPHDVLVVGVGAGQTPARFTRYPIRRLDAVDIEPRIFDVLRADFAGPWLADPRVRTLAEDGRNHLAHAAGRYDIVSLELGQLWRPGVAAFYTTECYRDVRARLAPGGLVSQFVPLAFLTPDRFRDLLTTFLAVFPHATLWSNTSEMLLVAGVDGTPRLDDSRLAAALADSAIAADLEWSPWGGPGDQLTRPGAIAGTFLAGPRGLAALARGGRVMHDDPPTFAWAVRDLGDDTGRDATFAPILAAHLDPVSEVVAGGAVPPGTEARRAANLADLAAAVALRRLAAARDRGDVGGAARAAAEAVAAHPGNLAANRLLGDSEVLMGRPAAAESAYSAALRIDPGDPRTHAGLGYLFVQSNRAAGAVAHLRAALVGAPDDPVLHNTLGAALAQTGDWSGGLAAFERAAQLDPANAGAAENARRLRAAIAQRDSVTRR